MSTSSPPNPSPSRPVSGLLTFTIIAGSSILFSSKGVVVKLAFAHGVDALTILTLRMGFALPFFVVMALVSSRHASPLSTRDWLQLGALGFIGYYVSSLVNFVGLQYVTVALERIILYSYPSIVLILSVLVWRKRIEPATWIAAAVAWIGIAISYRGELLLAPGSDRVALGAALIFLSALTYAIFILASGSVVLRVGPLRFTGIVVGISCSFVLLHALIARPLSGLFTLPAAVYGYGLVLAIFGTVLPSLLLSIGLRRAGPQPFAIISTIGPVTTLFLAWAFLDEIPTSAQWLGFALALAGSLGISLRKPAT